MLSAEVVQDPMVRWTESESELGARAFSHRVVRHCESVCLPPEILCVARYVRCHPVPRGCVFAPLVNSEWISFWCSHFLVR